MTRSRGWVPAVFGAAAILAAGISGAGAAGADDIKACAAVGSTAVRLACFDAAAKDVTEGDVAACARVSSDSVRLACFDAASGAAPAPRSTAAAAPPAASPAPPASPATGTVPKVSNDEELARLEAQMRAREAAMRARIQRLNQRAAAMEQRAAEIEQRTAKGEETQDPVDAFGEKYLDNQEKEPEETAEKKFGTPGDGTIDALTAEKYGKEAEEDEEDDGTVDEINVKITEIEEGPLGKVKVTLANGQVWKQIDSTRARYKRNGENVARIRRAWLGSFLMTINDKGAALRVRRLK